MKKILVPLLALIFAVLGFYGFTSPPSALPEKPQQIAAQTEAQFIVTEKRRQHILVGDDKGGGHRAGANRPGKSEFPASWDDDKIIATALAIANNGKIPMRPSGRYWLKMQEVEGLKIRVVLNRETGEVVTAYPLIPKGPR